MSRESLILLLGVVVLVTPSLGIPQDWKEYVFLVSGIALMILGYVLRRAAYKRSIESENGLRQTDSFVESTYTHRGTQSFDDVVE